MVVNYPGLQLLVEKPVEHVGWKMDIATEENILINNVPSQEVNGLLVLVIVNV